VQYNTGQYVTIFVMCTREVRCVFSNCVPNNMVVLSPETPTGLTLTFLADLEPGFKMAKTMFRVTSPIDLKNYTVVTFPDTAHGKSLV